MNFKRSKKKVRGDLKRYSIPKHVQIRELGLDIPEEPLHSSGFTKKKKPKRSDHKHEYVEEISDENKWRTTYEGVCKICGKRMRTRWVWKI
jgi:hypothetical protein